MAAGNVGKVGVPICHLGHMEALFAEIPLAKMNTSRIVNATTTCRLALRAAVEEFHGVNAPELCGTQGSSALEIR